MLYASLCMTGRPTNCIRYRCIDIVNRWIDLMRTAKRRNFNDFPIYIYVECWMLNVSFESNVIRTMFYVLISPYLLRCWWMTEIYLLVMPTTIIDATVLCLLLIAHAKYMYFLSVSCFDRVFFFVFFFFLYRSIALFIRHKMKRNQMSVCNVQVHRIYWW